ncbi:META domain-containing protein [Anianabacter salinae]|uniref:META domain-containing protein n=1 Tax=Anianabacter salinae TaxID=2851023 RepID=UPI00225E5BD0|nr:META domain-containing protein [Anianabacter salinae]MBV0913197.1 META domain-containing protein [Anianabacter salinae]
MLALFLTLPIVVAGYLADETVSGFAGGQTYALTELDGAPFPARATLGFPSEGRVAGEAPCNAYSAPQTVPYPWIRIGPIVATRRACPDLQAEAAFLGALPHMTLVEVLGGTLVLRNDAGREMVFQALRD